MTALSRPYSVFVAGLAAVALAAAVVLFGVRGWDTYTQAALAAGLALLAIFVVLEPAWMRERVTGRSAKYGSNAVILTLAVAAILGSGAFLSQRYNKRWDLTANQQFSLSEQTITILQNLKQPIQAVGYYQPGDETGQRASDLMKEYTSRSGQITYEVVDPVTRPQAARQAGITGPSIVLTSGDKRQTIISTDEQSITSALIKLTQTKEAVVYFTTGHQEFDPKGGTGRNDGYSIVNQYLQRDGYKVLTVNLAISNTIPTDATALVIASPQKPFSDAEVNLVRDYLKKGGKAAILLDPPINNATQPEPLTGLLAEWGVRPRVDVIADPQQSIASNPLTPATTKYAMTTVTNGLENALTFFPGARSLEILQPAPEGLIVTPLIQTSAASWGETDFNGLRTLQIRADGNDARGPLTIVASVEKGSANPTPGEPQTRLLVAGNASFVADNILQQVQGSANLDLFLNGVNWLAQSEDLIGIRPKPADDRRVTLTTDQSRWLLLSSVLILPALVFLYGAGVWWRRR